MVRDPDMKVHMPWTSEHDSVPVVVPHRCSYVYQILHPPWPAPAIANSGPGPASGAAKKQARRIRSGVQEHYRLEVCERVTAKQRGVAERVLQLLEPVPAPAPGPQRTSQRHRGRSRSRSRSGGCWRWGRRGPGGRSRGRPLGATCASCSPSPRPGRPTRTPTPAPAPGPAGLELAAAVEEARAGAAALHRLSLRQVDEACLLRLVQASSCGEPHGRVPGAWHLHPHAFRAAEAGGAGPAEGARLRPRLVWLLERPEAPFDFAAAPPDAALAALPEELPPPPAPPRPGPPAPPAPTRAGPVP
eukprot:tig00000093_g3457.t1